MGIYKGMDRVTVAEAAERLGVKEQAIRKRIQRDTILHDKDEDGRVYVYVDAYDEQRDEDEGTRDDTRTHTLVDSLQDQIEFLRSELQRKDAIIMTMAQRIPELEPPKPPHETNEKRPRSPRRSRAGVGDPGAGETHRRYAPRVVVAAVVRLETGRDGACPSDSKTRSRCPWSCSTDWKP